MVTIGLGSCDRDVTQEGGEDMPVPIYETPIAFAAPQHEEHAVTRAGTSLHDRNVNAFKVWGFKNMDYDDGTGSYGGLQTVFPGYTVNWQADVSATTTNSSGWEYILTNYADQTIKYWDWAAKAYRFFGVTGSESDDYTTYASHETNASYETYEFELPVDVSPVLDAQDEIDADATATKLANIPYVTRLWFSTGNTSDYPTKEFGKPVQLEFLKPYARVRFAFRYVFPREGVVLGTPCFKPTADYTAAEADKVKIARKGTVKVSYPLNGTDIRESYVTTASTAEADKSTRLEAFTEDYDLEDDTKEYPVTGDGWYNVFPNGSQGSYMLKVSVNHSDRQCVVPAAYMQWKPGYSYTYIFKITEEGGVEIDLVQSAFTDWTEIEDTHDVYNW